MGGPAARADPGASEVFGPHRLATARVVAETFFPEASLAGLARSDAFPDALTGGVLAGGAGGPMLLTEPGDLHEDTAAYLCANDATLGFVAVFGGTNAVSDEVLGLAEQRIRGEGCPGS